MELIGELEEIVDWSLTTTFLSTVFPLFVPAGTILFFKFSRKKYQAKQCQKMRVQFKGGYYLRAESIWGITVIELFCKLSVFYVFAINSHIRGIY